MKIIVSTLALAALSVFCVSAQNLPANEYFADGKVKSLFERVDDQSVRVMHYHSNGQLAEQGQYYKGKPDGRWQQWDLNGNKTAELNYVHGVREGEFRVYDRSKNTLTEVVYSAGKPYSTNKWLIDSNFASNAATK